MKKVFAFIIIVLFTGFKITAIEVNEDFLKTVSETEKEIEFENYVGPYLFYNTVEEIRSIGSYLANNIKIDKKNTANYSDKYLMHHIPKLEWEEGINSCDIFEISALALIDNIANIELIISQYLLEKYGYSIVDADLIAHVLVIYNAVYRGNLSHFKDNYTSEGSLNDNNEFLGLDLHYYNWPGKTFIYIPLSSKIVVGKLTNIDTDKLTDDSVIDNIKINDENNINLREEIIEFKERESDEIVHDITLEKQELEELVQLEAKIDQVSKDTTNNSMNVENAVDAVDAVDKDKAKITNEEDKLKDTEVLNNDKLTAEIQKKKESIEDKENELVIKENRILELRDDLAVDKNNLIIEKKSSTPEDYFKFIINKLSGNNTLGQIVNLTKDGKILNKSNVNSIRNNRFKVDNDNVFVIAGGDKSNQFVTLGKLKSDTLSLIKWSDVSCYENTPIILNGKYIYCIVKVEDRFYLGEFDSELKMTRQSAVSLEPTSYIVLSNNIFYIQGEYNSIKLLNLSDFITILEK